MTKQNTINATNTNTTGRKCDNCLAVNCQTLYRCSRCRSVTYCSRRCQEKHWKSVHRRVCSSYLLAQSSRKDSSFESGFNAKNKTRKKEDEEATHVEKEGTSRNGRLLNVCDKKSDVSADEARIAAAELYRSVMGLSLEAAHHDRLKAEKEAKRLLRDEVGNKRKNSSRRVERERKRSTKTTTALAKHDENAVNHKDDIRFPVPATESERGGEKEKKEWNNEKEEKKDIGVFVAKEYKKGQGQRRRRQIHSGGRCLIEDLVNISTYNITIIPPPPLLSIQNGDHADAESRMFQDDFVPCTAATSADVISVAARPFNRQHLKLELKPHPTIQCATVMRLIESNNDDDGGGERRATENSGYASTIFAVTLPGKIGVRGTSCNVESMCVAYNGAHGSTVCEIASAVKRDESGVISLRLAYSMDEDKLTSGRQRTSAVNVTQTEEVNMLRCRFCDFYLLSEGAGGIGGMVPLSSSDGAADTILRHKIERVLPLPSGYWDEISDYLSCYDGDSTVTFSSFSTEAVRGVAMEDSSVLLLHREDLGDHVCLLSVEGYGESPSPPQPGGGESGTGGDKEQSLLSMLPSKQNEHSGSSSGNGRDKGNRKSVAPQRIEDGVLYRGERLWRREGTGIGDKENSAAVRTVCCSQCCSTLGFAGYGEEAANNTVRLYKHRLAATGATRTIREAPDEAWSLESSPGRNNAAFRRNTCSSFIAGELVRYAESQAVFTFVVVMTSSLSNAAALASREGELHGGGMYGVHQGSLAKPCLILKLISWDAAICSMTLSYHQTEKKLISDIDDDCEDAPCVLFDDAVKVVFEETTTNMTTNTPTGHASELHFEQTQKWFWDDMDLCCPTPTNPSHISGTMQQQQKQQQQEQQKQEASVLVHLLEEEWMELRHVLREGSTFFSDKVQNATILLKTGGVKAASNATETSLSSDNAAHRIALSFLPWTSCR